MIIAQIIRSAMKERVVGNSWLFSRYYTPYGAYTNSHLDPFLHKIVQFRKNDPWEWKISEYGHVAKSKYQKYIVNTMLLFTCYHKQVQTNSSIYQFQILERKMTNFIEKWGTSCEHCDFWSLQVKIVFKIHNFVENSF